MRTATTADRDQVFEIASSHPDLNDFGAPWYSHEHRFDEGTVKVLEKDGKIVAFASVRFRKTDRGVSLYFLGVRDGYRGQGLGSTLLGDIKGEVETGSSHDFIELLCNKDNRKALDFWHAHDFEAVGEKSTAIRLRWTK